GHDDSARYSERSEDWQANMERLALKFDTARALVPAADIDEIVGADIAVIYYGTTRYAIEEAREQLAELGYGVSLMRLKALPIGPEVEGFIAKYERNLLIEMNRDGQMTAILRNELPAHAARIVPLAHLD